MDAGTIIMAIITFASVIVAIYSVYDGRQRYIDSRQPIISFKLSYYQNCLNLEILNTGKSPASDLIVHVRDIEYADCKYNMNQDNISGIPFDLFPDEVVSNQIAVIKTKPAKALVHLDLSYDDDWGGQQGIVRTVYFYNNEDAVLLTRDIELEEAN